jgi:hypothetical protein
MIFSPPSPKSMKKIEADDDLLSESQSLKNQEMSQPLPETPEKTFLAPPEKEELDDDLAYEFPTKSRRDMRGYGRVKRIIFYGSQTLK